MIMNRFKPYFKQYAVISFGCLLYAIGFTLFLAPTELNAGGISGISILLTHFFPTWNNGVIVFLLNLPLLVIGTIVFGGKFFFGTIYATTISSLMISVLEILFPNPMTSDLLCNSLAGGLLVGSGLGVVFRGEATTGGTDIVVRLIEKKLPYIKSGAIFLIVDSTIVFLTCLVYRNMEITLYSGIALFVSSQIFNWVLYGGMRAKLIIIIDQSNSPLPARLAEEHGVTKLSGTGAYTGADKTVLICAVDKRKYPAAKELIARSSPDAIVITAPAEGYWYGHAIS